MKRRKPDSLRILAGDNRETLHQVRPETIHTIVTSPPYWSVRDYDTPPVTFPAVKFCPAIGLPNLTVPEWTGQLGLEPDPWAFIGHLLLSFRAAWRALRRDGTLWVNMGDTWHSGDATSGARRRPGPPKRATHYNTPNRVSGSGLKPKDMVGIPWMLAKALQADGWTLRGEIIWHKPNPAPSSQKDRPTYAHETLFLLSRSEEYFYDNEAVKEQAIGSDTSIGTHWETGATGHQSLKGRHENERRSFRPRRMREKRDVWTIPTKSYKGAHFATFPPDLVRPCILAGTSEKGACPKCGAPWARVLEPAPIESLHSDPTTTGWRPTCVCGSPEELGLLPHDMERIETPTGRQTGDCQAVQEGRRDRESDGRGTRTITRYEHRHYADQLRLSPHRSTMQSMAGSNGLHAFDHYLRTDQAGARPIPPELLQHWIGLNWLTRVSPPEWQAPAPIPCVVADIFAGSGTVGEVALEYGRHAILCELADHYLPLIDQRTAVTPPLLNLA